MRHFCCENATFFKFFGLELSLKFLDCDWTWTEFKKIRTGSRSQNVTVSVATARVFSLDLEFFCFIWGSGVFIKDLGFFDSGQILEMYVVLLYFAFKNTVVSQA